MYIPTQFQSARNRRREELICQVAEQCTRELNAEIGARPRMDLSELRGYVRARAAVPVRKQTQLATIKLELDAITVAEIRDAALEHTVRLVVRDQRMRYQPPIVRRAA